MSTVVWQDITPAILAPTGLVSGGFPVVSFIFAQVAKGLGVRVVSS